MSRYPYAAVEVRTSDAYRLRESLEFGSEWTKDEATRAWGWGERRFRLAVTALRESGYPVISTSEAGSVYRKARSREEVEEFVSRELISRARNLEEQARRIRAAADKYFGSPQLPLVIESAAV